MPADYLDTSALAKHHHSGKGNGKGNGSGVIFKHGVETEAEFAALKRSALRWARRGRSGRPSGWA